MNRHEEFSREDAPPAFGDSILDRRKVVGYY